MKSCIGLENEVDSLSYCWCRHCSGRWHHY